MKGNKKIPSRLQRNGTQDIEFSHVNGPKDQAGGCLADLLFFYKYTELTYSAFLTVIYFQKNLFKSILELN